jgi:alkanesulfonate monooxygenase SsuD/methylene tetrahydromethanopterin reductase-like flavin-dependent oxidoreductase (luciferase family)
MLPAALASAVRTIEDLAPRRLTVTLGPWHQPLARAAGARRRSSIDGMVEATQIVRALLAGQRLTIDGRAFRLTDAALEREPVMTPLLWGVMGDRLVELAGAHADGVALNYAATVDRVAEVVSRAKAAAEQADRDPESLQFPAHVLTFLDNDRDRAVEQFRTLLDTAPALRHEARLGDGPVTAKAAAQHAACGPPEVLRDRLDEYLTAGATNVIVCDLGDPIDTVDTILRIA